jgi:DNA polymerase
MQDRKNAAVDETTALLELNEDERIAALKALEAEVRGCPLCKLSLTRTHAVPGDGNYHSVVLFVGEGPGFEEDKQGLPFVGRSGRFLTENLTRVGIARADVYITNIVKCRPPENRDPEPEEIAACAGYLTRQIALINPRIIVTLGRHSMNRWLPGASITKIHGQVKNIGHGRVLLPMFHPAAALRNPAWRAEFEKDFEKLPGLIERAQRANEAAARGEAPKAGAPHPGDADYAGPAPAAEAPATSAQPRTEDDGPAQMRLL